jgi:hypothetical protein
MPGRLKRIPDGETGSRNYFTVWQSDAFKASPAVQIRFVDNAPVPEDKFTGAEIEEGIARLKAAGPLKTGYDDAAIQSYAVFKRMRDEGSIPDGVRFQVCLPTTANVVAPFVQPAFQARIEPIYEEALFHAMRNIQDQIPHEDLAIQIDMAVDTAFWEGVLYSPWFGGDVKEYIVGYISRMIGQVDADVELGIHNCYGKCSTIQSLHFLQQRMLITIQQVIWSTATGLNLHLSPELSTEPSV